MINFGIIGTGDIVTKFIAGARLCPDVNLTALYSRTKERGDEFAAKYSIPYVFADFDEFVSSDKFDAVYIASPTSCHAPQSMALLKAKKHVLCEKPAASNVRELIETLSFAKENGLVFLEAMRPMFSPGFAWIKENIHKIGKIHQATLKFCKYSSRYDNFKNGIIENAFKSELSNGALMDIGVYPAAIMRALFGKPEKISSFAEIISGSIDASGAFLAGYKDFFVAVSYSKVNDSETDSEIIGENGSLVYSPGSNPADIFIKYRDGRIEKAEIFTKEHDLCYETEAFVKMIDNGGMEEYNEITLDTLEILDTVRKQCNIVFPADM